MPCAASPLKVTARSLTGLIGCYSPRNPAGRFPCCNPQERAQDLGINDRLDSLQIADGSKQKQSTQAEADKVPGRVFGNGDDIINPSSNRRRPVPTYMLVGFEPSEVWKQGPVFRRGRRPIRVSGSPSALVPARVTADRGFLPAAKATSSQAQSWELGISRLIGAASTPAGNPPAT